MFEFRDTGIVFQRREPGPRSLQRRKACGHIHGGVQTKASDPVGLLSTTADVDNIAIFVTNTAGTILKSGGRQKPDGRLGLGQTDHRRSADSQCRDGSHGPRRLRQLQKGAETYVTGAVGDKVTVAATFDQQQGSKVLYSGAGALSSFDVSVENANDENVYTHGNVSIKPVMARLQIKQVSFVANGSETVTNT